MSAYSRLILRDNPVGYWRLDEPAGSTTFTDSTGNGLTGSYGPNSSQSGPGFPGLVPSDPRGSLQNRGGTTSDGTMNGTNIVAPCSNSFSVECWVVMDSSNIGNNEILGADSGGANANRFFQFRLNAKKIQMEVNPGLAGQVDFNTASAIYNDGLLHHLVFSYNGQTGGIWIDGWLDPGSMKNQAITLQTGQHSLGFMRCLVGISNVPLVGQQSDVAFYNYALSPAQIETHYATGIGARPNIILPLIVGTGSAPTNKSDSDTATFTETSALAGIAKSDTDAANLADHAAALVASPAASDTASTADAVGSAALSSTDSATLADSGSVSDAVPPPAPGAETYTLSSAVSIAATITSSDSAGLSEAATSVVASALAVSDSDSASVAELGSNASGGIGPAFNGVCIAFDDDTLAVNPTWTRLDDPAGVA